MVGLSVDPNLARDQIGVIWHFSSKIRGAAKGMAERMLSTILCNTHEGLTAEGGSQFQV